MCGIAGWFDLRGQRLPDRMMVRAMSDAIKHRGPDGDGFHFEAGLGFAHRRLAVIDLAWPRGIQEGLSQPVALLLNEGEEVEELVNQAGYRFFTSAVDLCVYIEREVLAVEEAIS